MAFELTHQQRLATIAPHLGYEYWDRLASIDFPSTVTDRYDTAIATGVVDARDESCAPFIAGDLRVSDGFWRRSVGFLAVPLVLPFGAVVLRASRGRGGLSRTPSVLRGFQGAGLPSSLQGSYEGFRHPRWSIALDIPDALSTVITERLGGHDVELRDGWLIGYTDPRPVTDVFSVRRLSDTVRALHRGLAKAA